MCIHGITSINTTIRHFMAAGELTAPNSETPKPTSENSSWTNGTAFGEAGVVITEAPNSNICASTVENTPLCSQIEVPDGPMHGV